MILSSKWLGSALCLLLCSSALAEPAAPTAASAREQARVAKQQNALGLKLFKQGDYQGAINAFWAAYQAKQAPQLLFSIAQANRLKGELVAARDLYQRFLNDAPDSPLRVEAETQLAAVVGRDLRSEVVHQPRDVVVEGVEPGSGEDLGAFAEAAPFFAETRPRDRAHRPRIACNLQFRGLRRARWRPRGSPSPAPSPASTTSCARPRTSGPS